MENQVQEQRSVNYAFKIVGYLGHDNKLFDRTCVSCKGMYSSRLEQVCPKCGGVLSYITSADGKSMAISEGTVYPAFGPKQEKRDIAAISNRKNGLVPVYRFKMFSFMDEHGVLTPPAEHDRCRKGAKIEVLSINHQLVPSWFLTKGNTAKVELLIQVYTNYGDKVTMLTEGQYASRTVSHSVNPDGSPAPLVDANQAKLDYLEAEIKKLRAAQKPAPTAVPTGGAPWGGKDQINTAAAASVADPFEYA